MVIVEWSLGSFVFFVLRHPWVWQVFTPRMNQNVRFGIFTCHLADYVKNCTKVRAARAARLFSLIYPIRSLFSVVQSLNSPFFPPHIGAEPGRAKRESRITCIRMLKTNQSKIARPLSIRVHICSHQSVAQYLFQLARWKKKILWCWYCGKKTNWYVFYRGLYSYRQRLHVITLFSNIFSYCFCILNEFSKSFERKVWRVQVAHLHNAARALSSFQLWTNLDRDFFPSLWYCGQNKSNVV